MDATPASRSSDTTASSSMHRQHTDPFNYEDPAYMLVKDLILEEPKPDEKHVAKNEGVPQSIYLGWIKKQLEDEGSCLQLPMTILLLISFSYLAMSHLGQSKVYAIEESIEFDITENANFAWAHTFGHKGIEDVNSIADFWSWMRLGYIPLVVQPSWVYSEAYPEALGDSVLKGTNYSTDDLQLSWLFPGYEKAAPVQNDYMRYHKLIGGVRMIQHVAYANEEECRSSSHLDEGTAFKKWFSKPCSPAYTGELPIQLAETENFADLQRTQWLLPELDSLEELRHVLLDMEDGCNFAASTGAPISSCRCNFCKKQEPRQPWIDEQTDRVEVSFVVFNPVYGLYTYVGVNFFFNRGGHIQKFINSMSAWADPFSAPLMEQLPGLICDAVWLGAVLYVMLGETKEVVSLVRNSRESWYRSIWNDYLGIWNTIDWVSIIVALIILQCYATMRLAVSDVNAQLTEMIKISLEPPDRDTYEDGVAKFFLLVQEMCSQESEFRKMLCVYPMIVMLRLFKSFKAQPRLALVTDTFVEAKQDMFHFGLVFLSVLVCMMVNSVLFFGQDVQDFASVARAIHSCFRAMFGDWDWGDMKEIGFFKAQIWFWLFMMMMVMLLINMLLAIVMDAYTVVKGKSSTAPSLFEQCGTMWRRYLQSRRRERVRLNEVYDVFLKDADGDDKAMLQSSVKLKPEDVMAKINLPSQQANRTLANSLKEEWLRKEQETPVDNDTLTSQIKEILEHVEMRTDVISDDAEYIKDRLSYWDRIQVPGDPEYDFHFGGEAGTQEAFEHLDLATVVDNVSGEIGTMFITNMQRIENMQDSLQLQQDQLHQLISEMQMMVDQQVRCVASISEDISAIGSPRTYTAEEPDAPSADAPRY